MSSTHEEILFSRPLSFLETRRGQPLANEEGDEIILPRAIWEAWVDLYPAGSPMIVEITPIHTGVTRKACAGVFHTETNRNAYIPHWILEHLEYDHSDEEGMMIAVRPVLTPPPRATLIRLKPMDDALYHTDLRALFEERLYTFHVLEVGTVLSVYVPELGGYEACALVERLEPADSVILGTEVNVEFAEQEEAVVRTPTPPPPEPELLTPEAEDLEPQETVEERMARVRAAWVQRMRGAGAGANTE